VASVKSRFSQNTRKFLSTGACFFGYWERSFHEVVFGGGYRRYGWGLNEVPIPDPQTPSPEKQKNYSEIHWEHSHSLKETESDLKCLYYR
jgi:hypothetical protein